jgi:hypothetical protein
LQNFGGFATTIFRNFEAVIHTARIFRVENVTFLLIISCHILQKYYIFVKLVYIKKESNFVGSFLCQLFQAVTIFPAAAQAAAVAGDAR